MDTTENEIKSDPSPAVPPPTLEAVCRAWCLSIETSVRGLVAHKTVTDEAAEQAMLAVRHLEDARMRLGKVIQHTVGGGVSCFDSGRPTADDGR